MRKKNRTLVVDVTATVPWMVGRLVSWTCHRCEKESEEILRAKRLLWSLKKRPLMEISWAAAPTNADHSDSRALELGATLEVIEWAMAMLSGRTLARVTLDIARHSADLADEVDAASRQVVIELEGIRRTLLERNAESVGSELSRGQILSGTASAEATVA